MYDTVKGVDFGTEPWQLENCRRALTMAPSQGQAPVTNGELQRLVARLQAAEAELRALKQ
jgi:hypothetical protein